MGERNWELFTGKGAKGGRWATDRRTVRARARSRALTRLKERHRADFEALYLEELAREGIDDLNVDKRNRRARV